MTLVAASITISWTSRPTPLRPAAVLGHGPVTQLLARALADRVSRGIDLEVHAGDGYLLAIGDEAELPWVDGVTWLGRDGALLVPTTLAPTPDVGLVGRAIARHIGSRIGWVALLPDLVLVGERSMGIVDARALREIAGQRPSP